MDYNIFCLGDSITYGLNDNKGGWCDRLKVHFLEKEITDPNHSSIRIWNFGISGQTIKSFIENGTLQEPFTRIKKNKSNIFIIAFGANDCAYSTDESDFLTSTEDFTQSLKKIVDLFSEFGKIIYINITPISTDISNKPDKYNCIRSKEYISLFNDIISKHAKVTGSLFVDINSSFQESFKRDKQNLLSIDGLHPNSLGHNLMYLEIKAAIESLILVK